jgi:hypothetical protein
VGVEFSSVYAQGCQGTALPFDNSTSGNSRAPIPAFKWSRTNYLITASEMAAAGVSGTIDSIGWVYNIASGVGPATAPLKIYLEQTTDVGNTKAADWATSIATMTLVHDALTTIPDVADSVDIPFQNGLPFSFTPGPGQALYVAFDWGEYTGTLAAAGQQYVLCNSTGLAGGAHTGQSNVSQPPATTAASSFRAVTRLPVAAPEKDVSVDFLIHIGAIPLGPTGPQPIQATIFQNGGIDLTDVDVSVNVTGAEGHSDMVTVPFLEKCAESFATVTFDPFVPTVEGADTVTASVSVVGDADTSNDSLSLPLDVTADHYSYEHAGVPSDGGVGLTGTTGEFLARFSFTSPVLIGEVDVNFFAASATTYRIVVRADDGSGQPGALLYEDSVDRTVLIPGQETITLDNAVPAPVGNVYVGLRQTNTTNASFAFNNELPIRDNTFYYSLTPDVGPWFDFFDDGLTFKLNTGVTILECLEALEANVSVDGGNERPCFDFAILTCNTSGGAGPKTYKWYENGVEIAGETQSELFVFQEVGIFTYECVVSDACATDVSSGEVEVFFGPAATVSGDATICAGGATQIQADLNGSGPWNLVWSDGFVQNGVVASPAVRIVSPASTEVYTVTSVSDSNCDGTPRGSATVTVQTCLPPCEDPSVLPPQCEGLCPDPQDQCTFAPSVQQCACRPLAVTLESFTAQAAGRGAVHLSWTTTAEFNNMGFRVLRSQDGLAPVAISSLIPSRGTQLEGAHYEFVDSATKRRGSVYTYFLEDIDSEGTVTRRGGPVNVTISSTSRRNAASAGSKPGAQRR